MIRRPLVSIIVPVYNSALYLQQCLNSLCTQKTQDIEVLCIDDCSQDSSLEVLQQYKRVDPRIKVFQHKENRGCAAARNTGLENARGKYIYFIDSDDWIDAEYLDELLMIAERHDLPVVYNSNLLLEMTDGTSQLFEPGNFAASIGFDTTGFVDSHSNIGNFSYSTCCCLYRRDYLEELRVSFPEGLDYTDNYFHIATFIPQKKIYVTNKNAYHYRIHDDSICAKNRDSICGYDIIEVYEKILDYYRGNGYLDSCRLNFSELQKFVPRLKDTPEGYERLRRLVIKCHDRILKNSPLYREDELAFFDLVCSSPDYAAYSARVHEPLTTTEAHKEDAVKSRLNSLRKLAMKKLKATQACES